jgi:hypothetical protein
MTINYFYCRSPTGLLAYGSNHTVVIVDTIQLQVVQTLDKHKTAVVKVTYLKNYSIMGCLFISSLEIG